MKKDNSSYTEVIKSSHFYSSRLAQLSEYLMDDEDMRNSQMSFTDKDINQFMSHFYDIEVNSWPIIISHERVNEFKKLVKVFPVILDKAINGFFKGDVKYFAKYLNVSEFIAELYFTSKVNHKELLMRYDALYSSQKLKIIELNAGFTCGGWQLDLLLPQFKKFFSSFKKTTNWNLKFRSSLSGLFKLLADSIFNMHGLNANGKVLFYMVSHEFEGKKDLLASFQEEYKKHAKNKLINAELIFFNDFEKLHIDAEHIVKYDERVVNSVVFSAAEEFNVPEEIYLRLVECYLAGTVYMPDSPLHILYGNKQLLPLLCEEGIMGLLETDEQKMVKEHFPWAHKLQSSQVEWNGKGYLLKQLLIDFKDDFVIKRSESYQGKDVFIGHFLDDDNWLQAINDHMDDPYWIVQQYFDPDPIVMADARYGCGFYKPVWGIFDSGNSYAGCFVRAVEDNQSKGVINSSNGAMEFSVFEEQKIKNRLVL